MHGRLGIAVSVLALLAVPSSALASDTDLCWTETPGSSNPPNGRVIVQIESVDPNTDMDPDLPGWNNRADIYGRVTIDGMVHDLPKVNESNSPHWYPPDGEFVNEDPSASRFVPIRIEIFESDAVGGDDTVDINEMVGKARLDLVYDTCSLTLSGDLGNISTQESIVSPPVSGTFGA